MTKRDLIDAYVRGDVDRRGFIRKLSAMGVSAAAAAAYAGSFGQDAAAAPSRNGAGFVARVPDADDDYGIAVAIENIERAIRKFTARSEALVDRLEQIADRGNGNGNGPKPEMIATIKEQVAEHREALLGRLRERAGVSADASTINALADSPRLQTSGEVTVADLANEFNIQAGLAAALIPAIEVGEDRQLMTNIGLVTARYAALLSMYAGFDPIPSAFEVPIDPSTVEVDE